MDTDNHKRGYMHNPHIRQPQTQMFYYAREAPSWEIDNERGSIKPPCPVAADVWLIVDGTAKRPLKRRQMDIFG